MTDERPTVWVLGDQLRRDAGALAGHDPGDCRVLLVESDGLLGRHRWHRQRAHLVLSAMREVRRQLEPRAVTTVSHRGRRVEADELDQLTGYQIAHFGLCAIGAFLLTLGGRELADSLWVAISVVSTWGPSPGTGPFGDATGLGTYGRLVLIPGMLAGRLSILPLILAVVAGLRGKDAVRRGIRRLLRVTR